MYGGKLLCKNAETEDIDPNKRQCEGNCVYILARQFSQSQDIFTHTSSTKVITNLFGDRHCKIHTLQPLLLKLRRHCKSGGKICAVAKYRCMHDMMTETHPTRQQESGAVSSGVVSQPDLDAETRELMCVCSAYDDISLNSGVRYLKQVEQYNYGCATLTSLILATNQS